MEPILPGATIGVLGSGQLGRMLAFAARRMGFEVVIYSPGSGTPAGQVANAEITAGYEDEESLDRFARAVDVVTVEFENIPASALEFLERTTPVRPGPGTLYATQNRSREKEFLARHNLPHARTRKVSGGQELYEALESIGMPAVLKTAGFGYDGKGQLLLEREGDRGAALKQLETGPGVLEEFVDFEREISVLVARSPSGEITTCGPIENRHRNHILDVSIAPVEVEGEEARDLAREVAVALELQGLACVELFVTTGGGLLVNEIAPRPHNSGHLTIEACVVNQFEQQLRAVCDLPLSPMAFVRPAAMANLLGDLWLAGEPDWRSLLALPGVALHLYGKEQARAGRKMGHLTALGESASGATELVVRARAALSARAGQVTSPRT